jgi:hypothetical protein
MTRAASGFSFFVLVSSFLPSNAHAAERTTEEQASAAARAEVLFVEARKAMSAGNFDVACPMFASSNDLDPAVGTEINLADCYDRAEKSASAWAVWLRLATASDAKLGDHRPKRAEFLARAATAEGRLSRVRLEGASKLPADAIVRLDGRLASRSELQIPIPLDPGDHVLRVERDGGAFSEKKVVVPLGPAQTNVPLEVPNLALRTDLAAAPKEKAKSRSAPLPLVITGVAGALTFGVLGTVSGVSALNQRATAATQCAPYPYNCSPFGMEKNRDAQTAGMWSTISWVGAGVVAAATALVVLLWPQLEKSLP